MNRTFVLVAGMVLMVLGAQGGIRIAVDHDDGGLLSWLPGGFPVQLFCYVTVALTGVILAALGSQKNAE